MMDNLELILGKLDKIENYKLLRNEEVNNEIYSFYPNGTVIEIETSITYKEVYKEIILYISLSNEIPTLIPKIFIKKEIYDEIKYIPHIGDDCKICIFDEGLNSVFLADSYEIIEYIVFQAKNIIKKSENEVYRLEEFNKEFRAYWQITYGTHDRCSNIGLHLIHSFEPSLIKGIRLKDKLCNYEYVIYNEGREWDDFRKYLDNQNISYYHIEVFLIANEFTSPPYNLTFEKTLDVIKQNRSLFGSFKTSVNKNSYENVIVIFLNNVNDKIEIFGWAYKEAVLPASAIKGTKRNLTGYELLSNPFFGKNRVFRVIFDNLTPERLQLRTAGVIEESKSIVISGLGSVGSNLIYFLKNLPIDRFHLIDNETLKLENIYRHYLGLNFVSLSKVDALQKDMFKSNPFCKVEVKKCSIQKVINDKPEFVNQCDYHIVCVGDTGVETYILNSLEQNIITKPVLIFWVEPYLASGQMIFINPQDVANAKILLNSYCYKVLNDEDNDLNKIYIKEGSCQSGYYPYSSTYLIQFLSAVFPHLKKHIIEGNMVSTVYTWIGNKEFIMSKDLKISDFASNKKSYDLIINYL